MTTKTKYNYYESLGKKLADTLNLTFNHEGLITTSLGEKNVIGLGFIIKDLIDKENNNMEVIAMMEENDENHYKLGIITKQEHEEQIERIKKHIL